MTTRRRHLLIASTLLLVTLVVHLRAVGFGFSVFDDATLIVHNPTLHWSDAPGYFVQDFWPTLAPQYHNYYRPIVRLWFLINKTLFGLHAWAWHLALLLLHGMVVVMVFRLGLRLMGDELTAAMAALLFAVHPVHVENAVWLSGAEGPLLAVFFLGGFFAYLRWREQQKPREAVLCGCFTLVALLTKETAVALPALIVIYEWLYPRAPEARQRAANTVRAALPGAAAVAIYTAMRLFAIHAFATQQSPLSEVLMSWPLLLWRYAVLLLWPLRLAVLYDLNIVTHPTATTFWLPLLFVLLGAALLAWAFLRSRLAAFLGCWLLLPMLPPLVGVIAFLPNDILHDRYTYLSSMALMLLLAWGLRRLPSGGVEAFRLPAVSLGLCLALVCGWSLLSERQTMSWSSDIALFQHAVEVSPHNLRARNLLANQFYKAGNLPEALALYRATLRLKPDAWETNFAYGVTLASSGSLHQGELLLRRACQLDPTKAGSYLLLAQTLEAEKHPHQAAAVLKDGLSKVDAGQELLERALFALH